MTILNIMLGRKSGGLEQAAIDYAEALRYAGLTTLSLTAPDAWVNALLAAADIPYETLPQLGAWDPIAAYRLRRTAQRTSATAVICHGNRALSIALRALGGRVPVIAVAHNYFTKRFPAADACFCITEHARQQLITNGIAAERLYFMPNMVRLGSPHRTDKKTSAPSEIHAMRDHFQNPPVIGSMGRFVEKKGFDIYLNALAILKSRGVAFRATLGGGGELESELHEQLTSLGIADVCTMPGWVQDKPAFYAGLDVFVLPSRHEPFGIVLIEAMAHGIPVIAAAAEGPREIVNSVGGSGPPGSLGGSGPPAHGENGLLVPIDDAVALADALQQLLADPALAQRLRVQALADVQTHYSMQAMAGRLQSALSHIHLRA